MSGFDGIVPDPAIFKEVIMLCCAIKPLCAWNCQVPADSAHLMAHECVCVSADVVSVSQLHAISRKLWHTTDLPVPVALIVGV